MIAELRDNQYVYLSHITDAEDNILWIEFSVSRPNRYVDPSQLGSWDGVFRKYNRFKKRIARPLLQMLIDVCKKHNLPFKLVDKRDEWGYDTINIEEINEDFLPGIKLEDYQINAIQQACVHECGIVDVPTGGGKCLGKGTKVLMHDGTIKNVEQIIVGDLLMGDDSKPRAVLSTTSGMDDLYKVKQINGDDYVVNSEHILTLYRSKSNVKRDHAGRTIIDMNIQDYNNSSKWMKHILKGIKAPVEFTQKTLPIDPYMLGLWLGDGRATDIRFFLQPQKDKEIVQYLTTYCENNGYVLVEYPEKSDCIAYNIRLYEGLHRNTDMTGILQNDLKASFSRLDLFKNKHVPAIYKTSSREQRLQLLAGFIDADGHKHHSGYDITVKNNEIVEGIVFVARSLGFRVTLNERFKKNTKTGKGDIYAYLGIYGNTKEIPVKVQYKKCEERKSKKNPLVCGIDVSYYGHGEYFGFEIDGNKRFLLGDFTITHNTEVISGICKAIKCPTVILADQTVIIDQIKQRLELRDVIDEVGLFYAGKKPDGQLIVVGSIQSLSPPSKYPEMPSQKTGETEKAYSKRFERWEKSVQAFKTRKKNAKVLQKYVHDAEMVIVDECVHEDSWICTDHGLIRAGDLYQKLEEGQDIKARTGMEYHKITGWSEKLDQNIRVTTIKGRSLITSDNHPYAVFENGRIEYKHAKDIREKDLLLITNPGIKCAADDAWYHLGLFIGDGHLLNGRQVKWGVRKDADDWHIAGQSMARVWDGEYSFRVNARGDSVLRLKSKKFCEWLNSLGFTKGRKMGKVVPKFNVPSLDAASGLVRGLFDAEGSAYHDHVTFSSSDKPLAEFVQYVLSYLGIKSALSISSKSSDSRVNADWRVAIWCDDFLKFKNIVNFGFSRKRDRCTLDKARDSARHIDPRPWLEYWRLCGVRSINLSKILGLHSSDFSPSGKNNIGLSRLLSWCKRILIAANTVCLSYSDARALFGISDRTVSLYCGVDVKTSWNRRKKGDDSLWKGYMAEIQRQLKLKTADLELTSFSVEPVSQIEHSTEVVRLIDFTVPGPSCFEANGILVHNCDKAVSEQWKALFRFHFKGRRRIGVTGTPFDKAKPVEAIVLQEHLGSVIAKETRSRLTELGRIIPCEYYMMAYGLDGSIADSTAYDIAYDEYITNSDKFSLMISGLCKKYCVDDDGTLIIVDREALGLRLKDTLLEAGLKAEFIYGKTPKKQRDEALRSFERRDLNVLIGGKIINRGLDLAGGCETLIIASGGKLQSEFLQKIGRALRRNKRGKSKIFDFYFRCNKYLYQHSKVRLQTIIEAGYPIKIVLPGGLMDGRELVRNRFKIPNRYLRKN
jgi:superfamily II DNA or RNA helicase/intein/homing endonuclease